MSFVIFSPKNILLKVLTQEKRRRRGTEDIENKIYDEGVGCGSTNQQLDLYIRVCTLVMHYFTRSTCVKWNRVTLRVTKNPNKLKIKILPY